MMLMTFCDGSNQFKGWLPYPFVDGNTESVYKGNQLVSKEM